MNPAVWIAVAVIALITVLGSGLLLWHHQRMLKERAHLMQEAIRNRDLLFRLPIRYLLSGEKALQETLNRLGDHIREQVKMSEVESWENTRVLTHEIMNSTAPIASISQTLLHHPTVKNRDMEDGIQAINNTVQHLNSFVDSYRKYSELQKPVPEPVDLGVAIHDVEQLYHEVAWNNRLEEGIIVKTDPNLLRQILINLIKNAIEAGTRTMGLEIGFGSDGKVQLYVSNDGEPIPVDERSSIFVPFFTTKRKGSSIGLSLSRRLLTIQGGMMSLLDEPRIGFCTTFLLVFPSTSPLR